MRTVKKCAEHWLRRGVIRQERRCRSGSGIEQIQPPVFSVSDKQIPPKPDPWTITVAVIDSLQRVKTTNCLSVLIPLQYRQLEQYVYGS